MPPCRLRSVSSGNPSAVRVRHVRAGEQDLLRRLRLASLATDPDAFGSTYARDAGRLAIVGDAALLADADNPAAIAAATEEALARRDELAARGLERAGQLTWERAADALVRVYEAVCESV